MHVSRAAKCFAFVAGASAVAVPTLHTRDSWKELGCYADNVGGRALPHQQFLPGGGNSMTNKACQGACLEDGFKLAGTEYGGECFCGNTVQNGGKLVSDGCTMPCNGDQSQTCGGANRLSIFQTTSGESGDPPPPSKSSGKRGLCYNTDNPNKNAVYANLFKDYEKVTWAYDWGYPSWDLDKSFEFTPMLWGLPDGDIPQWDEAVHVSGTKNILGFNEPDLTYDASSNIIPQKAAEGYKKYMQPYANDVRISMPNVLWNNHDSSSGGNYNTATWTQYFLGNCTGCHFDFAPIHYYGVCEPGGGESGTEWFKTNVTNAHDVLRLPIWVTEFECYGSEEQQMTFLKEVMPWMDQQDYVEKYAYFGVFPKFLVNEAGDGLSELGKVYATT